MIKFALITVFCPLLAFAVSVVFHNEVFARAAHPVGLILQQIVQIAVQGFADAIHLLIGYTFCVVIANVSDCVRADAGFTGKSGLRPMLFP